VLSVCLKYKFSKMYAYHSPRKRKRYELFSPPGLPVQGMSLRMNGFHN
jgi:hypothetical protein